MADFGELIDYETTRIIRDRVRARYKRALKEVEDVAWKGDVKAWHDALSRLEVARQSCASWGITDP